jgi:epoxyqueuosine reductase
VRPEIVKTLARECGFELAGIARASLWTISRVTSRGAEGWRARCGTSRIAAEARRDARNLLPGAHSVICVGKLYNQPVPPEAEGQAVISRYAWGRDYHDVVRAGLEQLASKLAAIEPFEWKICVDTAPLLERSYARQAGLGWIGRNTSLINEPLGSWFFLGELITSLELEPGFPAPDRCGTCTRCIEACPTTAIVPSGEHWTIDARRCIII